MNRTGTFSSFLTHFHISLCLKFACLLLVLCLLLTGIRSVQASALPAEAVSSETGPAGEELSEEAHLPAEEPVEGRTETEDGEPDREETPADPGAGKEVTPEEEGVIPAEERTEAAEAPDSSDPDEAVISEEDLPDEEGTAVPEDADTEADPGAKEQETEASDGSGDPEAAWMAVRERLLREASGRKLIVLEGEDLQIYRAYQSFLASKNGGRRLLREAQLTAVDAGYDWQGSEKDVLYSSQWEMHLSAMNRSDKATGSAVYCLDLDKHYWINRDYRSISEYMTPKEEAALAWVLGHGVLKAGAPAEDAAARTGDPYLDFAATQTAVWCVIHDYGHTDASGNDSGVSFGSISPDTDRAGAQKTYDAVKLLYEGACAYAEANPKKEASFSLKIPENGKMQVSEDGKFLVSGWFKPVLTGQCTGFAVTADTEDASIEYRDREDRTSGGPC